MLRVLVVILAKLYLVMFVSLFVHELFHYISSLILKKKISGIYIGTPFFSVKLGKFHFSPFIIYGYVEIENDLLYSMNKRELIFFYLSGACGNILLFIATFFMSQNFFSHWFCILNICYAITSILPFAIKNNDMTALLEIIRNKDAKHS